MVRCSIAMSYSTSFTHAVLFFMSTGMRDHYRVSSVLMDLDNQQIIQVGLALGMNYAKLRRMSSLPGDMVAAWLRREDDVLQVSGAPTWKTLSEALKDTGQTGLSMKIRWQHQGQSLSLSIILVAGSSGVTHELTSHSLKSEVTLTMQVHCHHR